ncbi:MAG TPA: GNAT family protein [Desulfosporosinus sp.]|nr:GNAT family protein [Desulfosporosinus sp.]
MGDEIFKDFPELNTKRLNLREITMDDIESIYKLLSQPEVIKHDSFELFTHWKQAEEVIQWFGDEYKQKKAIIWGICLKDEAEVIGFCKSKIEIPKVRAGIGYSLRREYWNKGIMTEAVGSIINFTFNTINVHRIEATVATENYGSLKVLEKLGFIQEGILRKRSCFRGIYKDMVMLSILKHDHSSKLYEMINQWIDH